ncbi:MAG: hypothetical protein KDJ50_03840 [Alphaproteobacteria bacterium]|nr:hypothetical protein [Alphaproteobacteria bacterium]
MNPVGLRLVGETEEERANIQTTIVSEVLNAKKSGRTVVLMFDLDHTVGEYQPGKNSGISKDTEADQYFVDISDAGIVIAFNTGRPACFVKERYPLTASKIGFSQHLAISTENGARIRLPDHKEVSFAVDHIEELRKIASEQASLHQGTVVELEKENTVTLSLAKTFNRDAAYSHYMEFFLRLSPSFGDFSIISGVSQTDCYIELVNPQTNKGVASDIIYDHFDPRRNGLLKCFGDSAADVPMKVSTRRRGGVAVGIGPKACTGNSSVLLASPCEVREVLKNIRLGL